MNIILKYRKINNLTQCDLAYKLNLAGCKCEKSNISRWERGLRIPSSDVREALANILGITEQELFKDILKNIDVNNYGEKNDYKQNNAS